MLGAFLGPRVLTDKVGRELYTGSHLASMEAVASGRADLAAIDCVTWALTKPDLAGQLRVIGRAPCMVPALPYVVDASADASEIAAIQEGLRRCLTGTHANKANSLISRGLVLTSYIPSLLQKRTCSQLYKHFASPTLILINRWQLMKQPSEGV